MAACPVFKYFIHVAALLVGRLTMLKCMPLKFLFAFLIAGLTIVPAMAMSVTYNFEDVNDGPGGGGLSFTGSFSFDTVSGAISNETLQSTGGPVIDTWTPATQPYLFYGVDIGGASGSPGAFDLFFHSPSAAFPGSDGDLVGFSFFQLGTADFSPQSLDGVNPAGIFGLYYYTVDPNSSPVSIGDDFVDGCVTLGTACPATPLPPALPLFATGLGVIGLLARRRKRKFVQPAA